MSNNMQNIKEKKENEKLNYILCGRKPKMVLKRSKFQYRRQG